MPDFAGFLQIGERAEAFLRGHFRIDAVELVEIDAPDFKAAQAHLHALPQILGPADGIPFAGTLSG